MVTVPESVLYEIVDRSFVYLSFATSIQILTRSFCVLLLCYTWTCIATLFSLMYFSQIVKILSRYRPISGVERFPWFRQFIMVLVVNSLHKRGTTVSIAIFVNTTFNSSELSFDSFNLFASRSIINVSIATCMKNKKNNNKK